jgi:hypothetical protein
MGVRNVGYKLSLYYFTFSLIYAVILCTGQKLSR